MSKVYHDPRDVAYKFVDAEGQHVDVNYKDNLLVLEHRIIITSSSTPSGSEAARQVNSLVHEYTVLKEET